MYHPPPSSVPTTFLHLPLPLPRRSLPHLTPALGVAGESGSAVMETGIQTLVLFVTRIVGESLGAFASPHLENQDSPHRRCILDVLQGVS